MIKRSDDDLVETVVKDAERHIPGIRQKILGRKVNRFEYAFPVFRPKYGNILWDLHHDPSTRGPLFLAGDYTVYPTSGGAAESGINAYELVARYAETLE